ncbi:hypothetical protein HYW74_01970 [Candidatus Pacearchaeota archaeon]|nr:hypothetical protein [Candidatus Pacearchaeota archaeon]
MNSIVKNKYFDAFLKLMLLSAIIHVALLIVYSLFTQNFIILNYFNILDFDLIYSGIAEGITNFFISGLVVVIIYIVILKFFTKK